MEEKNIKQLIAVPISEKNIIIGKNYNKEALEGMLNFLESLYEDLIYDIDKEGINPLEAINGELAEIKRLRKVWL